MFDSPRRLIMMLAIKKYTLNSKFHHTVFIYQAQININIGTVTSISLYQLVPLDALHLAAGATGLFSQGVTAVVHGCSVRALGPRVKLSHSWRGGSQCHLWLSC